MHLPRPPATPIKIQNEEIESVDNFTYLGSIISPKDEAAKDITNRLNKAKAAFVMLRPVWISQQYSRTTKLRIFKSNVITTLLYGAECWRFTDSDTQKLERFQRKCLRYILRIWWPNVISNRNLMQQTNFIPIEKEIEKRRMRLLGHVLRMPEYRIPKISLHWTPAQGKR